MIWEPARQMTRTAQAKIGRPEAELVQALGRPRYVVTAATLGARSVNYPWAGMNFVPVPSRPVRNKVLLYSNFNVAVYVYINERGLVEHVATAGT